MSNHVSLEIEFQVMSNHVSMEIEFQVMSNNVSCYICLPVRIRRTRPKIPLRISELFVSQLALIEFIRTGINLI